MDVEPGKWAVLKGDSGLVVALIDAADAESVEGRPMVWIQGRRGLSAAQVRFPCSAILIVVDSHMEAQAAKAQLA